jgi:hypothetical protein
MRGEEISSSSIDIPVPRPVAHAKSKRSVVDGLQSDSDFGRDDSDLGALVRGKRDVDGENRGAVDGLGSDSDFVDDTEDSDEDPLESMRRKNIAAAQAEMLDEDKRVCIERDGEMMPLGGRAGKDVRFLRGMQVCRVGCEVSSKTDRFSVSAVCMYACIRVCMHAYIRTQIHTAAVCTSHTNFRTSTPPFFCFFVLF